MVSEKERTQCGVSDTSGCIWTYLADMRASEGKYHVHYNFFFDPNKPVSAIPANKNGSAILPPAAALAPTLWPQFHLRWACPSEDQTDKLEAECRNMAKKFSDLKKVNFLVCILVIILHLITTPSPY